MGTGADALASALDRAGIRVVFGVAGSHNLPIVIGLREKGLRFVGMQHPAAAVSAADGHARRSGMTACVMTGPSSDLAPLLPSLTEARAVNTPLLVLAPDPSQPAPDARGGRSPADPPPDLSDLAQRGPFVGLLTPTAPDGLVAAVRSARDTAAGRPAGPVILQLRRALLRGSGDDEPEEGVEAGEAPVAAAEGVEHVQLRRAANVVDSSAKIVVWAGGGALRASAGGAVAELAEKLGAPVMTTAQAAGLLPARHPCLVGMPPHLPAIGAIWDDADLVIAIGTSFDAEGTQGWAQPPPNALISINLDAVDAGRRYPPDVLLRGDARTLTKALADTVNYRGGTAVVRSRLDEARQTARRSLEASHEPELAFLSAFGAAVPDRATVVADHCVAGRWLAAFHEWTLPRTLQIPSTVDHAGFALAAGIGAASTGSAEPVVVVTGDQSALMHLGELATIAKEGMALTVLLVDDGGAGRLRPLLAEREQDPAMLDRPTPDFAATARTFGLRADGLERVDEAFSDALRAHIAAPDPTVLVLRTSLAAPPTARHRWYRRVTSRRRQA